MRRLGEYLRSHYNPHCLEATAFVSPVKRCNDSIYYVYQVIISRYEQQLNRDLNHKYFELPRIENRVCYFSVGVMDIIRSIILFNLFIQRRSE